MSQLTHRLGRMTGRDPREQHRSATPLELLFDLAFVVAFGTAADELAHAVAAAHTLTAVVGFGFAVFAISWAWVNFSWFASAFDTDDWVYRLWTMVQMGGVVVLALGLPAMFASIEEGDHLDNGVMVLGYVVMRVAMVAQWLRAARQDPVHARVCRAYVLAVLVAQVGWIALLLADTSVVVGFVVGVVLWGVEMAGPLVAERRAGGTPWHAHHIAERYGLMVIIALGEGLIGTTAALGAVIGPEGPGWSLDAVLVLVAGVAVTFGLWWTYFVIPHADLLHAHRERSFGWGYGHLLVFGSVVAVGAGLHVAAYFLEHQAEVGPTDVALSVAVPLALYVVVLYSLYTIFTRTIDRFHLALVLGSAGLLVLGVVVAASGGSLAVALLVLALVPWVTVVGYEVKGHQHNQEVLDAL